ncbi:serine hydrolase domain-containing protein [Streptomyces griseoruber]|uniref:serine hydrolase domain-containing protein n=1 Tax=Streptomyces griseoruber TaxID=1943 RepID=UPI00378D43CA
MRVIRLIGAVLGTTLVVGTGVQSASADTAGGVRLPAKKLDRAALRASPDDVREAGMYGVYSSVRDGAPAWTGAAGVADVDTGRPVRPGMRHRIGSVTKSFTAVAVLQQVERGRIALDAPIGDYVPDLVPGKRGRTVTVRMLLNHTSGIGDYMPGAFPSPAQNSTSSIDEGRFRRIPARELVRLGLADPATGRPGAAWSYSNTNYVLAGLLLERVTGQDAGTYLTRNVIDRVGLRHTVYPRGPYISGPPAKMYEAYFGVIDPPRDYSVYDMSWGSTAGALISTTDDLNTFYRALLGGRLLGRAALTEMLRTVPGSDGLGHGLGIDSVDLPDCGRFWGHDGSVFGAGTIALSSRDGRRQLALGWNLTKYQRLGEDGTVEPSDIDAALFEHITRALCPTPRRPSAKTGSGAGAGAGVGAEGGAAAEAATDGDTDGHADADARKVIPTGLLGVGLPPKDAMVRAR